MLLNVALTQAEWIAANNNGCELWNPAPHLNETVVWEGVGCANGRAEGVGVASWYRDGEPSEVATGTFGNGRLEGQGSWTWASGHQYRGDFVDGNFEGKGIFIWPDGSEYRGEFSNHQQHGWGVHVAANGARYEGPYFQGERHGIGRCYEPGGGWKTCRWYKGERLDDPLHASIQAAGSSDAVSWKGCSEHLVTT